MVLELIIIGGAIYYYVKKNKANKAKRAAFAAGQPWLHRDGSVTYPPPPYSGSSPYLHQDHKRQIPVESPRDYHYSDISAPTSAPVSEKTPWVTETREVAARMNEKI